ncbi:MAG TPA: hypothetical protein VN695_12575 [Streptosporangiaceae bacterium]|nr:hypothetical protein [Streptosporangiaceae bacterium]
MACLLPPWDEVLMSKKLIRESVAVAGLAGLALAGAVGIAGAATQSGAGATLRSADGGQARPARPPFATRAESLRLARELLAKAVLPSGTHRFRGRKLPAALASPADEPSSSHLVDSHRVFTERRSMVVVAAFLRHHHPAGWALDGTGGGYQTVHGKPVLTFRQRAIIDKLTRVLNGLPASPGGVAHCPVMLRVYYLTFEPVKGQAASGKIEKIADHLLRGSHKPAP